MTSPRPRLSENAWPSIVYAIGDVHGCLRELQCLERSIYADSSNLFGEKWIVMLGDYVDRGPNSAEVIEHLLVPPSDDFKRICLAGNHETLMLQFLETPYSSHPWLQVGGWDTLVSYGIDVKRIKWANKRYVQEMLRVTIPEEHVEFLRRLPICLSLPGTFFAHAGIRPDVPLEKQAENDLLWIREPFLSGHIEERLRVVHGHTSALEPVATKSRIGIDTAAYATGKLTAAVLHEDRHRFLASVAQ